MCREWSFHSNLKYMVCEVNSVLDGNNQLNIQCVIGEYKVLNDQPDIQCVIEKTSIDVLNESWRVERALTCWTSLDVLNEHWRAEWLAWHSDNHSDQSSKTILPSWLKIPCSKYVHDKQVLFKIWTTTCVLTCDMDLMGHVGKPMKRASFNSLGEYSYGQSVKYESFFVLACYVDEATLKHVHIQGRNHGGTAVTCVCFYLSRAHDILSRAHELLSYQVVRTT